MMHTDAAFSSETMLPSAAWWERLARRKDNEGRSGRREGVLFADYVLAPEGDSL